MPWYLTGLIDAEGSFGFNINKSDSNPLGYNISPRFNITMHIRDINILSEIQSYLKVGNIKSYNSFVYYDINSIKDIRV